MDRAPGGADDLARRAIARAEPGVEVRRLRVREAAGRHFVDVVAGVRADAAMAEGHAVADSIESAVREALPGSDVVVHVEPAASERDLRERASGAALTVRDVREVHNVRLLSIDDRQELSLHLKLPSDLDLAAAHEVTDRVEAAIRAALPGISRVHTHIEPLTPAAAGARPRPADVAEEHEVILEAVRELTGRAPRDVRFQSDQRGLVALLTIDVPRARTLADAHAKATEIEQRIRARAPRLVDVVVHTEPD
jgi:divalent metal cation (Fe/Co/Zn/Cd) transporter